MAGLGCGGGEAPPATAASTPAQGGEREETATVEPDEGYAEADESLPEAPWLAAHLPAQDAPEAVLDAWSEADNREWCAPMAPSEVGEATDRKSVV